VPAPLTWLVGGRRAGKTSLLRHLEFMTDTAGSGLLPLYWDMQGCENSADLSYELYLALDDVRSRFEALRVDVSHCEGEDALAILARLGSALRRADRQLLLLVDEAEVLTKIAVREHAWLGDLRTELFAGGHKTILTSTKLLSQIIDLTFSAAAPPFLAGVNIIHLTNLDVVSAISLVEQRQETMPFVVAPEIVEFILATTNRHPYLMQFLCQRLCVDDGGARPTLRPPTEADLEPDQILTGYLRIDFKHLTALERRLLLAVAQSGAADEAALAAAMPDVHPVRQRIFLWGLERLGYLRSYRGLWYVANQFLSRWLGREWERLGDLEGANLAVDGLEMMLHSAHERARLNCHFEVESAALDLAALRQLAAQNRHKPRPEIAQEMDRLQKLLDNARNDLHRAFRLDPTV
jgi:hypothetical protein